MIDLYNYLSQVNPNELIKEGKNSYRLRSHHSLVISNGKWYWFSHDFGGRSAYYYLVKVEGYSPKEANQALKEIDPTKMQQVETKKKSELFFLPKASKDFSKLYDYLVTQRKLDPRIIDECIQKKMLYLDWKEENIVFVGYDSSSIPRFGCIRNRLTNRKKDLMNSNKAYSFHITGISKTLHLFEAPIDLLSYLSLLKQLNMPIQDHYLSLGGLSNKALVCYLEEHVMSKLVFHLDADQAGMNAFLRFQKQYSNKYLVVNRSTTHYKDINELLVDLTNKIEEII